MSCTQFKTFKKELHLPSPFLKIGDLFWPDFAFLFIRGVRTGRTGLNNYLMVFEEWRFLVWREIQMRKIF